MKARPPLALRALPAALALLGLIPATGAAAVHVWTGAASSNWSEAANWVDGLPPTGANTELLLDSAARASSVNDIAGSFALHGLTLGPLALAPTLSGQPLRFQGAGAFLRMQSDGGTGQVQSDMVLDTTLSLDGGPSFNSQLYLLGRISGAGGLAAVSGITVLGNSSNSFTGVATVGSGARLGVGGASLGSSSGVQVASGGELQLVGTGSNAITQVNQAIQLGGLLSSSAKKVNNFLGQPVSGAFYGGAITLTGDARVRALGATGTGLQSTLLVVGGAIDRAGHGLTLETTGVNNALNVGTVGGPGTLQLLPQGGDITLGSVSGDGAVRASGTGGKVTLGALSGSGTFDVAFDADSFGQVMTNGVISGARKLTVSGGTLELGSVAHSFVGQILMSGSGQITASDETRLGAASNTLRFDQGGALQLTQSASLSRAVHTTGGGGTVLVAGNSVGTISSVISGDGGIAFANFGIRSALTLSGANSFAGGLGIGSGILLGFNSDANLGAAGGSVTLGGILSLPAGFELNRPLAVSGSDASVTAAFAGRHLISGNISGDGTLNLGGNGAATVFALSGSNSQSGGTKVVAATLELDHDGQLGAAGGVLDVGRANGINNLGGALRATANLSIAATRSTSFRDMTVDTHGFDVVFNQPINGLGLTKAGAGTWTLNTANSNNSNTNRVDIQQGTLALGVDEALGARTTVLMADTTRLALGGHTLALTEIHDTASSVIDFGSGGRLNPLFGTLNGSLQGQGSLIIGRNGFSAGDVTLNGANSFVGTVEVNNGSRLTLGHAQALGDAGNLLKLDNGSLATSARLAAPLVISDATNIQVGAGGAGFRAEGQSLIIERSLGGSAPLRIQGGSGPDSGSNGEKIDVRLANTGNSFTGDLVLGDPQGFGLGVVGITADGSLGAASNKLVLGKRFFNGESTRVAQGGLRAWDSLTLPASRSLLLDGAAGDMGGMAGFIDTNSHVVVVDGSIGELNAELGLLKTGAGTLVLNGVQAYTGATVVNEGTLGGHGEVQRLLLQQATLAPGESAGLFSVRQDLSFSDGAVLAIELGGLTRGSGHDALDVGGTLDLGGDTTLRLSLINGFSAQAGQQFDLLHWGALQGQFGAIDSSGLQLDKGMRLDLSRLYVDGVISVSAVPEPQQWSLMLLGVLGLLAWRRRQTD